MPAPIIPSETIECRKIAYSPSAPPELPGVGTISAEALINTILANILTLVNVPKPFKITKAQRLKRVN